MEFPPLKQKKNEKIEWRFDLDISQFYYHHKEAPSFRLEKEEDKEQTG